MFTSGCVSCPCAIVPLPVSCLVVHLQVLASVACPCAVVPLPVKCPVQLCLCVGVLWGLFVLGCDCCVSLCGCASRPCAVVSLPVKHPCLDVDLCEGCSCAVVLPCVKCLRTAVSASCPCAAVRLWEGCVKVVYTVVHPCAVVSRPCEVVHP